MIKCNVSNVAIEITETETLTAGRVGLECQFTFSSEWDGLAITAYFLGETTNAVVVSGNTVVVPAASMVAPGYKLYVGVVGRDAQGNIVIPTLWASAGKIKTSPGEEEEPTPSPDVVAQIQLMAINAVNTANAAMQVITDHYAEIEEVGTEQVAAVNSAGTTQTGNVNTAGATQVAAVQAKGEEVLDSIPEDYTTLSNDVSDLKSSFNAVADVTVIETGETTTTNIRADLTWEDGNMNLSGGVGTGTDKRHSNKIAVAEGDTIAYQNANFVFNYVTAFNGDTAVSDKGVINVNSYTVPSGVTHVVLSEFTSRGTAAILHTTTVYTVKNIYEDDIEEANTALEDTKALSIAEETSVTWERGKYKAADGSTGSQSGLNYSSAIPVAEGDVLFYQNNNYKFRFVCAYNSAGFAVTSKGSGSEINFFVVPEGIVSVIVTVYDAPINSGVSLLHISAPNVKKAKLSPFGNGSEIVRSDSMASGDALTLSGNNCKIGSRYQFSCKVSQFGSIEFAMGTTHVVVDGTNIVFKNGTTTQATIPHGLTIGTELMLLIQNETSIRPSYVSVASLGNKFEFNGAENITFLLDSGVPTITCVSGALTNCAFSFTSSHIFKPVWIFGDSYLSWYDTRWTYYAAEDGNTENVFFSGYAGQNSQSALAILNNELKLATPKVLVWCLGMNDPDTTDAVNAGWDMVYTQVKEICAYKGIKLVLYTTPTTPIMNNRHKNAIVRASGYRYVDVDGLIRINDNGEWITGTLDSDNVHPTALGAKVIYHKFISDLPEIMTT